MDDLKRPMRSWSPASMNSERKGCSDLWRRGRDVAFRIRERSCPRHSTRTAVACSRRVRRRPAATRPMIRMWLDFGTLTAARCLNSGVSTSINTVPLLPYSRTDALFNGNGFVLQTPFCGLENVLVQSARKRVSARQAETNSEGWTQHLRQSRSRNADPQKDSC